MKAPAMSSSSLRFLAPLLLVAATLAACGP